MADRTQMAASGTSRHKSIEVSSAEIDINSHSAPLKISHKYVN